VRPLGTVAVSAPEETKPTFFSAFRTPPTDSHARGLDANFVVLPPQAAPPAVPSMVDVMVTSVSSIVQPNVGSIAHTLTVRSATTVRAPARLAVQPSSSTTLTS
jgi:hypothetical protein